MSVERPIKKTDWVILIIFVMLTCVGLVAFALLMGGTAVGVLVILGFAGFIGLCVIMAQNARILTLLERISMHQDASGAVRSGE